MVFRVGDDCVAINPADKTKTQPTTDLEMPGPYGEVSKIAPNEWLCIYSSEKDSLAEVKQRKLTLPPHTFTVWRRNRG